MYCAISQFNHDAQGWTGDATNKELEGLRQALHGLKVRKVITYEPGVDGAGGTFHYKYHNNEKA